MPPTMPAIHPLCTSLLLALASSGLHAETIDDASEPHRLDRVVVTATRTARTVDGVPASVSVIEREDLHARPVMDVADALRGLPGVNLQGIGMGRRGISVRGMDPGYTVTLVDGLRVNTSGNVIAHSDFDFGWVPQEAIDRIEFVRGPMSSLYGSDALGGVVNLITRTATDDWRGSIGLNHGWRKDAAGGDWWQAGVYAGGPLLQDQLGLSVFAEQRQQDKAFDPYRPLATRFEGNRAASGSALLSWTPDAQQRVDLRVLAGREERDRHVLLTGPRPSAYQTRDTVHRLLQALTHQGDWERMRSRVSLMRARTDKENWRSQGQAQGRQQVEDDNLNGHLAFDLGGRQQLVVGGEWRRETINDVLINNAGRDSSVQRALFVQDEISFSPQWSMVIGNRYDRHDRFGGHHSPRAYMVRELGEGWTVKGGIGRGFRAPTLKQMSPEYTATIAGSFVLYGNPDLQPEVSTSYELATSWHGDRSHFDAAVFDNRLRGLIESVCIADCNQPGVIATRTYQNVDRARTRGFELSARTELGRDWSLSGSYTYVDARDLGKQRKLRLRPHHTAGMRLHWRPLADVQAELHGEYNGRQVDYPTRGPTIQVPADVLWSLHARWQAQPWLALRAGVENLTNARQNSADFSYPYAQYGRTFHAGVQMVF